MIKLRGRGVFSSEISSWGQLAGTLAGGNQSVARCNACSEPSALQGETSNFQDVNPEMEVSFRTFKSAC